MSNRDGIYKRKDQKGFSISYTDQSGKRRRKKVHVRTVAEAEKLRAGAMARVETGKILGVIPPSDDLFEEVTQKYLAHQQVHLTPKEYERTEGIMRIHLMPRFAGRKFADIQRIELEQYVIDRVQERANPHTILKEVNKIKRLWSLAVSWKVVPINITHKLETPPLPEDRVRFLEPAQLPKLLEHCPEWLRPIVVFAISTGLRRGEVLRVRYMDINRERTRVYLPKVKNRKPRGVPLNKTAQLALEAAWDPKAKPTDRLFPGISLNQVSVEFKRARVRAGIEDFRFHDNRHTYASWLVMSGVSIRVVSELLGHSSVNQTMKYAHLSTEHVENEASRIDNVFMPELVKDETKLLEEGKEEK